jgi:orotate phosphoribosyltransferase
MGRHILAIEKSKRILEVAEEVGALRYGDFTLSSGAKSNYYFDGRLISLNPEGAYLLGQAFLERLQDIDIDYVGGPAMAAIPLVTAIALVSYLDGRNISAFFVRGETKGHGMQNQIEGNLPLGSKVAIIDDVCTSGGSIVGAIQAVESLRCKVAVILSVLDRKQGGSDKLISEGYRFETLLTAGIDGKVVVST